VLSLRWIPVRALRTFCPTRHLEDLACRIWRLPATRLLYIPNGVDTARFAEPRCDGVSGFVQRPGELVIGTVAPLRPEKNIGRLLRVFAMLDLSHPVRLVIAGDGAGRIPLGRLAADLGIADRVIFPGRVLS